MTFPASIVTDRLLVCAADPAAAPPVNEAIRESFDQLHAWMPWAGAMPSVDETRAHLEAAAERFRSGAEQSLLIWEKDSARLLGAIGVHPRSPDPRCREIGYWLRTAATGCGYMTEAVRVTAHAAWTALDLHLIEIRTSARNVASQRVALRAGFALASVVADGRIDPDGTPSDTHLYSMTGNASTHDTPGTAPAA